MNYSDQECNKNAKCINYYNSNTTTIKCIKYENNNQMEQECKMCKLPEK